MTDIEAENGRFQTIIKSINTAKRDREEDDVDTCFCAARWFPLSLDPFVNFSQVLQVGLEKNLEMTIKGLKTIQYMSDKDKEYYTKLYQEFIALAPDFEDIVKCLKTDSNTVKTLLAKLSTAASDARSEDSTRLKTAGLSYLMKDPSKDIINPPITKDSPKSIRGFNHPVTARLLCPIKYLAQFDHNPEVTMKALSDGSLKVTAGDWPSFMYEETEYKPDDMEKGLLRGYTIVRTCRHVYTSPSSALLTGAGSRKGTKKTKAELNGMTQLTASSIAYSVVQTFWWLCRATQWQEVVGQVNLHKLFKNVIRLFKDDPEDKWCVEVLKWWNKQVPGLQRLTPGVEPTTDETNDDDDDDLNAILAARAKRRCMESMATGSKCRNEDRPTVNDEDSVSIDNPRNTDTCNAPIDSVVLDLVVLEPRKGRKASARGKGKKRR